jgi:hypothetical protein
LLAVDLGVRTGLAHYAADGRLVWYRSHNFGAASRLRRAIPALLDANPPLQYLVIEGGGLLARAWLAEAEAREIEVRQVSAETWRGLLFYPRQQRTGEIAKRTADSFARRVIAWSGARQPTSLRHDAAEAILVGLWAVVELGWLPDVPAGVRHGARSVE